MPILVSPTDPRGPAAIDILLADAFKTFLDPEGRVSYGIPSQSQPGLHYRATDNNCVCSDMRYRPWNPCKHVLAVRMYEELLKQGEAF